MSSPEKATNRSNGEQKLAAPSISLPKGGGAIRGMGEKFAANPVTGTGSMSVPLAMSPGRSGFGPQLSLSYDSGSGNSPFGFGWSLSLPAITRKTDKGLPQYRDAEESDVYVLSGAEDLVPMLRPDNTRFKDDTTAPGYVIHRYRPRIEGLFARIERWTQGNGDVHWRSISKDNILTIYGKDSNTRICDPEDATRVFSWLICETRDDKGNAVLYEYKTEDGIGVDLAQAHQRNRGGREDKRRTANRYLKRIKYGNRVSLLDSAGRRPHVLSPAQIDNPGWMFEVVFDYGEHDPASPRPRDDAEKDAAGVLKYPWKPRQDPFSTYRAGFEVRTIRLCQRVLMFHHFPGEDGVGNDCLVRSTDFTYSYEQNPNDTRNPIYSFLLAVTQTGYKRAAAGGYLAKSLPPVEFAYTQPIVQDIVEEVAFASLENLPIGLDGAAYQWTDLHGEGIPGILTEQTGAWFYKRNLSPLNEKRDNGTARTEAKFAPMERVALKPNLALAGGAQFMDLAGDGQPDLVILDGPMPGLYEHDEAEGWQPFRPFPSRLHRDMRDPNLKFVDLDGDGHADVLITEDNAFVWHASLAEAGFGPARRVAQSLDEEKGPRLVFADGTQSIYLADMSGDGLTDLVRVRNGAVCYWPNLGYGRFGARVTMDLPGHPDHPPCFDHPDQFDHKRVRLADIDGSGTTDIIYLHRDGVRLYFNQSGNSWSAPHVLRVFPRVDDVASIIPTDLLGNGTACLVWSSPLPGDARRQMRYVNLMGGHKPHLLVKTVNNLGAETRVQYAPSARFYLQDKRDGKPWITRLPFPVHVVERVETYDRISRNRFVTRYAYHHGHFDGEEREFRGFGMVEQWDTEEIGSVPADQESSTATNLDAASFVPPVHTKTWFHTGVYLGREHVSDFFAGLLDAEDKGEYYCEPALTDPQARAWLLPDTVLPPSVPLDEEREACRALKGAMLRQEVYADDAPPDASEKIIKRAQTPYTVTEQNFTIERLQPRGGNRHAVFFTHPCEAITYHYERSPVDPRIQHALTLEVDAFGNVLKEVVIGYSRRQHDASLPLQADRDKQIQRLIIYTENRVAKDPNTYAIDTAFDYHTPLPCETRAYELTGFEPENDSARFSFEEWARNGFALPASAANLFYEQSANHTTQQKRLIEHVRTYYRRNDLAGALPLGELQSLALPFESYKLAFTPGLVTQVYGARVTDTMLQNEGRYVHTEGDANWWLPSGQVFYSPKTTDSLAQELAYARSHFFLPHRYRDPFGQIAFVSYDSDDANPQKNHNLLTVKTEDAVGNTVTVVNDYRVLQPTQMTDPNGNRSEVRFDALAMVIGTAVMGKATGAVEGDSFTTFTTDLTPQQIKDYLDAVDPRPLGITHLGTATTRIIYNLDRVPACAATIARETHVSDLGQGAQTRMQLSFSYSDGFGREIQKKIQAELDPVPQRDANGKIIVGADGQPQMTANDVSPRWVGSGWTIFNNKGKPVRQYEPFFTDTHHHEFEVKIGVSPVLFYDPVERVVATLHPNHTWEKVVFDPWQQTTYDVNDTVLNADGSTDPKNDPDVAGFFRRQPDMDYLPTWHGLRTDPTHAAAFATRYPDATNRANETKAATKAAAHANTPTTAHFDTLGRPFLTVTRNKVVCPGHALDGKQDEFHTRVELDIEGNQRAVRDADVQNEDALGRIVMRYDYDLLGNRIHQSSMEAGKRWTLADVAGKPIRAWDSRGHTFHTEYDPLRRPLRRFVTGADSNNPNQALLTERLVYGEQHPQAAQRNLRGKLYLHLDQAGVVTSEAHDFKGNLLRGSRRIAKEYKQTIDWSAVDAALPGIATAAFNPDALDAALVPRLELGTYTSRTTYDALNRPIQLIAPHSDQPGTRVNVIQPIYNEANLLEQVHAWLNQHTEPAAWLDPVTANLHAVTDIDYDAKGQRQHIDYGNGVSTFHTYDPLTFRLTHLLTRRNAVVFPDDCPQPPPAGWPGCQVQNLHYSYDPAGNITHIRDEAQQTIYFKNQRVEPSADYTYDALYRLIEATGREHLGQTGGAPNAPSPHSYNDASRVRRLSADAAGRFAPNDGKAMGTYTERYVYDAVGNFLNMRHLGSDPAHPGWRRSYVYNETSLIEDGTGVTLLKTSNRLSSTTVGNGSPITEPYDYDPHGNMLRMSQLQVMQSNYNDQLEMTQRQKINDQDADGVERHGERTWYVYAAAGQRVRKVTELANNGGPKDERIYLGGFEIHRRHSGANAGLVRETLHIVDDTRRIALVETRNDVDDGTAKQLTRYQFGNHLGSASLELDDQAQIISYEEYTPYGSTVYQTVRSQTETPKCYRYTGKERDEETGFTYHGARYYAPWLGRWVNPDPASLTDGTNLYRYVSGNPISLRDSTGMYGLKDLNRDVGRAQRFVGLIIPGMAVTQAVVSDVTQNLTEAITGKSAPQEGVPAKPLSITERTNAATDAVAAAVPFAPSPRRSRDVGQALGQAIRGKISKQEAVAKVVKTIDPTGLTAKTVETAEALDRAEIASNTGKTGDAVGNYVDAGLGFIDIVQTGTLLVLGLRAGGGKSGGGGKGTSPKPATAPALPAESPSFPPPQPRPTISPTPEPPVQPGVSPAKPSTTTQPGVPRDPTHSGSMFHYTDIPPEKFQEGVRAGTSFTVEGDLSTKQAVSRLGLRRAPTHVVEVIDKGQFKLAKPPIVQEHPLGQGGAYDYYTPGAIPHEDIKGIHEMDRGGPRRY